MPAYNAERFIREAVDSILAQRFRDFELIIIDDGSIDGTASIIQSYSDQRIRFVQKNNEGVAATLNRGINLAKGQYMWSYEKVTCLSNSTRQGFLKSIENAIIGITTNTTKRKFSTAIGIAVGWWIFFFTYPISLRDRRLIARPGSHFISI